LLAQGVGLGRRVVRRGRRARRRGRRRRGRRRRGRGGGRRGRVERRADVDVRAPRAHPHGVHCRGGRVRGHDLRLRVRHQADGRLVDDDGRLVRRDVAVLELQLVVVCVRQVRELPLCTERGREEVGGGMRRRPDGKERGGVTDRSWAALCSPGTAWWRGAGSS
jgi:hypothetical protein